MPPDAVSQIFAAALQHHRAGRLADAEAIYRRILAAQPNHADALHYLGVIAHQVGRQDAAVELIERALAIDPGNASALSNLGEAYRASGRFTEAIDRYRAALQWKPNDAAVENNLGLALAALARTDEAMAAYTRAMSITPNNAEIHNNLATLLVQQDLFEKGMASYRRALELNPNNAAVHNNMGNAFKDRGHFEEALGSFQRALQLAPTLADAHYNVANTLREIGRFDEAVAAYRAGLALKPEHFETHINLGNTLKDLGQLDDAAALYRRARQLRPDDPRAASNLIYLLHFHPAYDDAKIAEENRCWDEKFGGPLKPFIKKQDRDREPDRRLRVGYVSPDFYRQAEAHFVVPLLEAHDHQQFEIHGYSSVRRPDDVTERLRRSADVWHDVRRFDDEALAKQIRDDRIDILVDLTMHMAGNRLLVFARKPAPVQVTWLAYPGSTGLAAMDYRLTDFHLDPPSSETSPYSESSIHLPDVWCCYDPLADEPGVNSLPAASGAGITFGCLNNLCKINEPTLALYARVLQAVAGSRLVLLVPEGSARRRILEQFHHYGTSAECIEFFGRTNREQYLKIYHGIDIALDTLPYNGITTTCDALWMGVPVVSLAGKTAAGRAGAGLLSAIHLPELAATTVDEFVQAAQRLAGDRPRLVELRRTLRSRLEASVLMDAPRFARHVEAAYRTLWRRWCAADA